MKLLSLSEIGANIRSRRKALGMSQTELSALSGVSQPTISSLESGNRNSIGWLKLAAIFDALGGLTLMKEDESCSQ